MPIPIPNLDDRTFNDLVAEGRSLIPRIAPEWTNHNPADPGITLVELFAYLSELLIYRLNRVTDANLGSFLRLLNGPDWAPSGTDPDALARDLRATILALRRRERAVTSEDYEALAREADARVVRARAVPRRNLLMDLALEHPANISLVVVPRPAGARFARLDRVPLAGLVHTAGAASTALNGVGTSFTTQADVADTLDLGGVGTRGVISVTADDLLTLDAPIALPGPPGVAAVRIDQVPLSGTVHTGSVATTALTGVGTIFTRELRPGDAVAIDGVGTRGVVAIASDVALTVDAPVTIGGPVGEPGLIGAVRSYLEPRRLLTAQVNVVGPQYVDVRVQAALVAASGVRELVAKTDTLEALLRFLDPLAGGTDGGGWPFGRDVFVSELYALLEGLATVDHVTSVTVSTADAARLLRTTGGEMVGIALRSYELPSPKIVAHDVRVQAL